MRTYAGTLRCSEFQGCGHFGTITKRPDYADTFGDHDTVSWFERCPNVLCSDTESFFCITESSPYCSDLSPLMKPVRTLWSGHWDGWIRGSLCGMYVVSTGC